MDKANVDCALVRLRKHIAGSGICGGGSPTPKVSARLADLADVRSRIAALEAELKESALLLGKGSEREAALMARLAEAEKRLQHRARQVIELDQQVDNLCKTIAAIKTAVPEVQRMFDNISVLSGILIEYKAGRGGGE